MYDIIVCAGGKCGGTTLKNTMIRSGYNTLHIHNLTSFGVSDALNNNNIIDIINNLDNNKKQIYIIDIYRNPIERKISSFFQNISKHCPEYTNFTINKLIKFFNLLFLNDIEEYHPINQLLDYYKLPHFKNFDYENKYNIMKYNNINFIKIRFQDINEWNTILSNIFKKEIIIYPKNLTEKKKIYNLFIEFKNNYYTSPQYINNILINDKEFYIYNTISDQEFYIKKYLCKLNNNIINENIPEDFNWVDYIKLNEDLNHFDEEQSKIHYELYGIKEGRKYKLENIPEDFNWVDYIKLNEDLNHFDEEQSKIHYELYGIKEGRKYKLENIPEDFNSLDYIELNEDLKHFDEEQTKIHYIKKEYK